MLAFQYIPFYFGLSTASAVSSANNKELLRAVNFHLPVLLLSSVFSILSPII